MKTKKALLWLFGGFFLLAIGTIIHLLVLPVPEEIDSFYLVKLILLLIIITLSAIGIFGYCTGEDLEDIKKILKDGFKLERIETGSMFYPTCDYIDFSEADCNFNLRCQIQMMDEEGCPEKCPAFVRYEPSPTGKGAFGGMVLGGFLGLIGGAIGIIIGGIAGGALGNAVESETMEKRNPLQIKIEECRIKRIKPIFSISSDQT